MLRPQPGQAPVPEGATVEAVVACPAMGPTSWVSFLGLPRLSTAHQEGGLDRERIAQGRAGACGAARKTVVQTPLLGVWAQPPSLLSRHLCGHPPR